jgi:hypothetical protein
MPWNVLLAELVLGLGAALALGTGAALLRYWRTGSFPGQTERPPSFTPVWGKVLLGLLLVVWAIASLDRAGVL